MYRLRAEPFWELSERIDQLREKSPSQVAACVRDYWNDPSNAAARDQETTADESARTTLEFQAMLSMPSPNPDFEYMWPSLVNGAKTDPLVFEALQKVVIAWMKEPVIPEPVRAVVIELLQGGFRPDARRAPKVKPGSYFKTRQLALAVFAVHQRAGYRLSANPTHPENAFAVVEDATGVEYETVRDAWKKHKDKLRRN